MGRFISSHTFICVDGTDEAVKKAGKLKQQGKKYEVRFHQLRFRARLDVLLVRCKTATSFSSNLTIEIAVKRCAYKFQKAIFYSFVIEKSQYIRNTTILQRNSCVFASIRDSSSQPFSLLWMPAHQKKISWWRYQVAACY